MTIALVLAGGPASAQPTSSTLVLDKSGTLDVGGDGLATPGDSINYTFVVQNLEDPQQGCGSISNIAVSDPLISPIDCGGMTSADPGGSFNCTGSYLIMQDDIDAGSVYNQATATGGTECDEVPQMSRDDHLQPIEQVADIDLAKAGVLDLGGDGIANPGDVINYSLTVTNTGNVTLSNVTLSDPSLASIDCPGGHPIATLAPAAQVVCTGSYTIDQADVDAGVRENTADVTGDEPLQETAAATRAVSSQATAQVSIPQQPSIQLAKTGVADLGADGFADPGDLVNYTLVVSNPGNVTLTGVAVTDPLIATVSCPSGNPIPTMAPAVTETCTGSYTLTAADVSAGNLVNNAGASGTDPMAQAVSAADTDTVMLPAAVPSTGTVALVALALALAVASALALRRSAVRG